MRNVTCMVRGLGPIDTSRICFIRHANSDLKSRLDMKDNRKCITISDLIADFDLKPLNINNLS